LAVFVNFGQKNWRFSRFLRQFLFKFITLVPAFVFFYRNGTSVWWTAASRWRLASPSAQSSPSPSSSGGRGPSFSGSGRVSAWCPILWNSHFGRNVFGQMFILEFWTKMNLKLLNITYNGTEKL
jgi:hypothetical protein